MKSIRKVGGQVLTRGTTLPSLPMIQLKLHRVRQAFHHAQQDVQTLILASDRWEYFMSERGSKQAECSAVWGIERQLSLSPSLNSGLDKSESNRGESKGQTPWFQVSSALQSGAAGGS